MRTSSAWRLNRFQPAASSARSRSASVVSRIGSTAWMRNGSMIVVQRSMRRSIRRVPGRRGRPRPRPRRRRRHLARAGRRSTGRAPRTDRPIGSSGPSWLASTLIAGGSRRGSHGPGCLTGVRSRVRGRLPGTRAARAISPCVGLMGSGKTTVGRLVAAALGWPLRDSDADIAAREGRTVRELRDDARDGGDARDRGARTCSTALDGRRPSVICAAASIIDDEACRAALSATRRCSSCGCTSRPRPAARRFAARTAPAPLRRRPRGRSSTGQAAQRGTRGSGRSTPVEVDHRRRDARGRRRGGAGRVRERWELPGADGR